MTRLALVSLLALSLLAPCAIADPPADDEVVAAWERMQRDDPETIVLEQLEPRLYRFETERFPYEGRLRVLNVSLDAIAWPEHEETTMAVVEVELVDVPEEFFARHAHSYGVWQSTNMLYRVPETGEWMTSREWQQHVLSCAMPGMGALGLLTSNLFWIVFLGVAILLLLFVWRKASRNMNVAMDAHETALAEQQRGLTLMEDAIALNREANETLSRILAVLESRDR